MNIVFFASDKTREQRLAAAFAQGAQKHGHTVAVRGCDQHPFDPDFDLACMVGVKSRILWQQVKSMRIPTMMFDKGYSRHKRGGCWEYWRVAYDSHQPSDATMMKRYEGARFDQLKLSPRPWRTGGGHILIAGSSEKYHAFYGLSNPTRYARKLVNELRLYTDRPIIYRPKPSWRGAEPIIGTAFSQGKRPLLDDLKDCHALVTHGSNPCYEAALMGVPSIITGNGVMKSISSTKLREVENPLLGNRLPVFHALAYHQWTLAEMASGLAFQTMRRWF